MFRPELASRPLGLHFQPLLHHGNVGLTDIPHLLAHLGHSSNTQPFLVARPSQPHPSLPHRSLPHPSLPHPSQPHPSLAHPSLLIPPQFGLTRQFQGQLNPTLGVHLLMVSIIMLRMGTTHSSQV